MFLLCFPNNVFKSMLVYIFNSSLNHIFRVLHLHNFISWRTSHLHSSHIRSQLHIFNSLRHCIFSLPLEAWTQKFSHSFYLFISSKFYLLTFFASSIIHLIIFSQFYIFCAQKYFYIIIFSYITSWCTLNLYSCTSSILHLIKSS